MLNLLHPSATKESNVII